MLHRAHVRIPEGSSRKQIGKANLIKTKKKDKIFVGEMF
jgi:hypothetical protein